MPALQKTLFILYHQTKVEMQTHWVRIGNSMIISPTADILAEAGNEDGTIYADIDLELVRTLKTTTPVAFEE